MRASRPTTLRAKLVRTMVTTLAVVGFATLAVVAAMNVIASHKTLLTIETNLHDSIVEKGTGLVTNQALALRDLVADNAFSDVGRLVERTVATDHDLVYGLFVDSSGKAWGFATSKSATDIPLYWKGLGIDLRSAQAAGVKTVHRRVAKVSGFEFSMPVLDDKGDPLGALIYAISDAPLQRALADARGSSRRTLVLTVALLILLGGATTFLGVELSRKAAAKITRPVSELTAAADTLAMGKHDIRVEITSGDELQALGNSFNHMAQELQESYGRLAEMNRTLEVKVDERTSELATRNRDMRLVLDNVNQGFLTISVEGALAPERSAIVDHWFGGYGPGTQFADYIRAVDSTYADNFQMGYQAILEDFLPRELLLQQMPTRLRSAGRELRCSYIVISKSDQLDGLLIVINDVTEELLHARQDSERKEVLAMFEAFTTDRQGFINFMDEANEMVAHLAESDLEKQQRTLHTLKGNASLVGFGMVAQIAHELEDVIREQDTALSTAELAPLSDRWRMINQSLKRFIGDRPHDVLELQVREIEQVEQMIRAEAPATRVLDRLASWWLEPAEVPMQRLGRYAVALANRLGKGPVRLEVQSNGIRLAPKAWAGFWTELVHVIRNAVDHGLETSSQRANAGKPGGAHLRISARLQSDDRLVVGQSGDRLVVEVADDGRGVDWEAIRRKALLRGLPCSTREDLVQAMLTSGLTTRDQVTTLSGRGVGLSVVKQHVEGMGGSMVVESEGGQGTCFRFSFPLRDIGPRFGIDVQTDDARSAA